MKTQNRHSKSANSIDLKIINATTAPGITASDPVWTVEPCDVVTRAYDWPMVALSREQALAQVLPVIR